MPVAISLNTPIEDLHQFRIARLGEILSRKLATALASYSNKKQAADATVEDLLNYLPMRYEDRSHLARIQDLANGMEASLELQVKLAGGYQVRNKRSFGKSQLFIFEASGVDAGKTGRPVVVWWFISGSHAHEIVNFYTKKLARGTRFIAFGRWEWDSRRNTFALRLQKPADELEILTTSDDESSTEQGEETSDPSLAAIHAGRRVPIYRKLGDFNSKRLREIIHAVLATLTDKAILETLPADLRQRAKLISRAKALREIHFPPQDASMDDYERSRSPAHVRMIFEDFFWLAFAVALKRGKRTKESKGAVIQIDRRVTDSIASVLPFKLTRAQRNVVLQIFNDMKSPAPMNRLLQGDVGSGKTIVALIAMIAAMENQYQT